GMNRSAAGDEVRDFFDRQHESHDYESLKSMTRELDMAAARLLEARVSGECLSIGGIWDFFTWEDRLTSLTVLDLSEEMLKEYCPDGARRVVGDFYETSFEKGSFDSVVFTLMLHHTPRGNWRECQSRVEQAVERGREWLRPDGRLFILEYCPHPSVVWAEQALLPVTRRFLARFGQPLVVMYSRTFYERTLEHNFGTCVATEIHPAGFNYWKWYPIFMSIRWLRVPLVVYPRLHVFEAVLKTGG
ncbi:MAG: methyltransferase domain-containing protein, partial [Nitrososphaerales archaeon]